MRYRSLWAGLCLTAAATVSADVDQRVLNNGNLVLEGIPDIPTELADSLNQYQNVRAASVRDFTANGKGLFITTRFGDVTQLHRVDQPGGARRQLTFLNEPIAGIERHPHNDTVLYSADEGGSEFSQIFLLDTRTGQSRLLTDGTSRNGGMLWSHRGDQFAYRSTARNGRSNDVWVMDPNEPDNARVVLESPDGSSWGAVAWSRDDNRLLISQYVSIADVRIYVLDLATGELTPVAGDAEAPSANRAFDFAPDGQSLYFSTDADGEFNQLALRNLQTGETTLISQDIPWNVENFVLSDSGRRAAFLVNEGGLSALYLLDTTSLEYEKLDVLPTGLAGSLVFHGDDRLALTVNTATSPSDAYVIDVNGAADKASLTRWTYSEVGGLNTDSFVSPELISYRSFDDLEVPAFVYKPKGPGPHPVVISIHGGPEGQARPSFSSTYQLWLERLGAAVVVPNVRGSAGYGKTYVGLDNGYKREDSVKDIGALLDWIAEQPDLDADRVAVFGGSYGGYMVLASAVHYSDRLSAAVDIVGISNFVTFLENTQDYRRDLRRVEYGDERDPEMRAHLEAISPLNNVDQINVPMFVVQGQNDPRVPVTEAEQIVSALRETERPVWYMNALDEGHGYRKKQNRDIYNQAVVLFFEQFLTEKK